MGRKQPKDYHRLAEERGFEWIGPDVHNTRTKTGWRCVKGHEWKARYNDIQQGRGCRRCAYAAQRHSPKHYHALAAQFGFRWLGPSVRNIMVRTGWECPEGHRWKAKYHYVQQGYGCPECVAAARRVPPEEYRNLAVVRGFEWLGPEVPNAGAKTGWRCPEGHEWSIQYHKIQQGNGCPHCANKVPKTPIDYHMMASECGFEWLGPLPVSVRDETRWRCLEGHEWMTSYHRLQQGSGCPQCVDVVNGVRVSQPQRELCNLLGGVLNYEFQGKYIDIALFLKDTPIAIEYDSWFWHGHKLDQDQERAAWLQERGWRVLCIRSNGMIPSLNQLRMAIEQVLDRSTYQEIIMSDWGKGPTFGSVQEQQRIS